MVRPMNWEAMAAEAARFRRDGREMMEPEEERGCNFSGVMYDVDSLPGVGTVVQFCTCVCPVHEATAG